MGSDKLLAWRHDYCCASDEERPCESIRWWFNGRVAAAAAASAAAAAAAAAAVASTTKLSRLLFRTWTRK